MSFGYGDYSQRQAQTTSSTTQHSGALPEPSAPPLTVDARTATVAPATILASGTAAAEATPHTPTGQPNLNHSDQDARMHSASHSALASAPPLMSPLPLLDGHPHVSNAESSTTSSLPTPSAPPLEEAAPDNTSPSANPEEPDLENMTAEQLEAFLQHSEEANRADAIANIVDSNANLSDANANVIDTNANVLDANANSADSLANVIDTNLNQIEASAQLDNQQRAQLSDVNALMSAANADAAVHAEAVSFHDQNQALGRQIILPSAQGVRLLSPEDISRMDPSERRRAAQDFAFIYAGGDIEAPEHVMHYFTPSAPMTTHRSDGTTVSMPVNRINTMSDEEHKKNIRGFMCFAFVLRQGRFNLLMMFGRIRQRRPDTEEAGRHRPEATQTQQSQAPPEQESVSARPHAPSLPGRVVPLPVSIVIDFYSRTERIMNNFRERKYEDKERIERNRVQDDQQTDIRRDNIQSTYLLRDRIQEFHESEEVGEVDGQIPQIYQRMLGT